MSSVQIQPTSSSTSKCNQCQEAKERLLYVLPVPGGKKEFCSEPCLTAYRRAQKAAASANSVNSASSNNTSGAATPTSAPPAVNGHKDNKDSSSNVGVDTTSANNSDSNKSDKHDKNSDASTSEDKAETSKTDPLSPRKSSSSSDSEPSFSWKDYLKETASTAAPPTFFKQSSEPPDNEFIVEAKLEAVDPRSQMACIATVIGVQGPRVRLRLDGSDTKNDFWKMVDDSELHEIGHCKIAYSQFIWFNSILF